MHPGSVFDPHSSLAEPITHLFLIVGFVMAAILLLIIFLVVYSAIRYRHKEGNALPPQRFGNNKVEIAWTVAPFIVLVLIFVATVNAMNHSQPAPQANQQPDLLITAHQWWWEAQYTESGAVAANEIHIPVGKRMLVRLESADVIHDWWVPELGPKMDAVPGQPNFLWLEADAAGSYRGTCAEFCGAEHAWMRILVIAQSESDYMNWIEHQVRSSSRSLPDTQAQRGAQLFQQLTCLNCHAIGGTAAISRIGPDLTHLASRETLAAGLLENTPSNLTTWLTDPQAVKPGVHMPNFQLESGQIADLTAYLETLR